jgi:hypothetical protein
MDIEKRLALLQYTYAASVAETVNTYDRLKALSTVVERRKERQTQTAPYLNQQLSIESVEDVFLQAIGNLWLRQLVCGKNCGRLHSHGKIL